MSILDSILDSIIPRKPWRPGVRFVCKVSDLKLIWPPCREELFYQLGLRQFGDFNRIKLEPPPPLRTLVTLAVDAEEGTKHSQLSKPELVEVIITLTVFQL